MTGPESAERMLRETGCDAVLIGRAARGNPWIFRQTIHCLETGELIPRPSMEEVRTMMLRHAALLKEYKGEYTAVREMRKHVWLVYGRLSSIPQDCGNVSMKWKRWSNWRKLSA